MNRDQRRPFNIRHLLKSPLIIACLLYLAVFIIHTPTGSI